MPKPTTSLVFASVFALVVSLVGVSSGCDDRADEGKADKASKGDGSSKKADAKVTVDPNGNVQVQAGTGGAVNIDGAQ